MGSKKLVFTLMLLIFVSAVSAQHYYAPDQQISNSQFSTGFEVPQYDSQQEILAELVAPFLFMTILLQMLLNNVLHFVYRDQDDYPPALRMVDNRPDVSRQATMMAIAITAILVPTPFWDYVRYAIGSLGLLAVTMVVGTMLFLFYLFIRA